MASFIEKLIDRYIYNFNGVITSENLEYFGRKYPDQIRLFRLFNAYVNNHKTIQNERVGQKNIILEEK